MKLNYGFWELEFADDESPERLFYNETKHKWVGRDEYLNNEEDFISSVCFIRTYKAAKAHIKRHDEIPKGARFRVVSSFVNCDRYITKR